MCQESCTAFQHNDSLHRIEDASVTIGEQFRELMSRFYTTPRIVQIKNEAAQVPEPIPFIGAMFVAPLKVEAKPGSSRTPTQRFNMLLNMLNSGKLLVDLPEVWKQEQDMGLIDSATAMERRITKNMGNPSTAWLVTGQIPGAAPNASSPKKQGSKRKSSQAAPVCYNSAMGGIVKRSAQNAAGLGSPISAYPSGESALQGRRTTARPRDTTLTAAPPAGLMPPPKPPTPFAGVDIPSELPTEWGYVPDGICHRRLKLPVKKCPDFKRRRRSRRSAATLNTLTKLVSHYTSKGDGGGAPTSVAPESGESGNSDDAHFRRRLTPNTIPPLESANR